MKDLIIIEEGIIDLVHRIKFRKAKTNSQGRLDEGSKKINHQTKRLQKATKPPIGTNLAKDEYNHLFEYSYRCV